LSKSVRNHIMAGVAAIVLVGGVATFVAPLALAQNGQGQQNGQGEPGGNDSAGPGGQGPADQGGRPDAAGDEVESDGRGPQYGQPEEGEDQGGKPVWGQEGIPEVELGRLSVIRSPDATLDRALAEVVANFDPATMSVYYEMSAATFSDTMEQSWDTVTIIDSPLENLALLTELWTTGDVSLPGIDVPEDNTMVDLAAIFIGVASDKTLPVSNATVLALATIIGVSLPTDTLQDIADKAEDVRLAVLVGHG